MKRLQIWLGAFWVVLGTGAVANAQNFSLALTVLVQESITQVSPNVYEYKTTKIRVTQKDVLGRLAPYYSFPAGSILDCNGDFEIRSSSGTLLHTVNGGYLNLTGYSSVISGRSDNNPGGSGRVKYFTPVDFDVNIGAMGFTLHSVSQETLSHNAAGATDSYSYTLNGGGTLDGKDATASGKMKFRFQIL